MSPQGEHFQIADARFFCEARCLPATQLTVTKHGQNNMVQMSEWASTHYRSCSRRVFPVNHLHRYWQANKNNQETEHTYNIKITQCKKVDLAKRTKGGIRKKNRLRYETEPSIPPTSVNEYRIELGRQRQIWLIPIADERVGVQVKLWDPLRTRAIPEFFWGDNSRTCAISTERTFSFSFTFTWFLGVSHAAS